MGSISGLTEKKSYNAPLPKQIKLNPYLKKYKFDFEPGTRRQRFLNWSQHLVTTTTTCSKSNFNSNTNSNFNFNSISTVNYEACPRSRSQAFGNWTEYKHGYNSRIFWWVKFIFSPGPGSKWEIFAKNATFQLDKWTRVQRSNF